MERRRGGGGASGGRPPPSLQLRFGAQWSPRYGAPGGRAQDFLLWTGERITAVASSARACIRPLRWTPSRGREATFGHPALPPLGNRLQVENAPEQLSAEGPAAVTAQPTTARGRKSQRDRLRRPGPTLRSFECRGAASSSQVRWVSGGAGDQVTLGWYRAARPERP